MEEEAAVVVPEENPRLFHEEMRDFNVRAVCVEEVFAGTGYSPRRHLWRTHKEPERSYLAAIKEWLLEPVFYDTDDSRNRYDPGSDEVKFSTITSSKGGVGIKIGSHAMQSPKYASARHPLVCMMLFARKLFGNTFACPKSMVPRSILNLLRGLLSSTSPKVYEAGWVPAKTRPESRNAGVAEETPMGSIGSNNTSRVPVLFDVSKRAESEPGSTAIPSATLPAIEAQENEDVAIYGAMSDTDTLTDMGSMAKGLASAPSLHKQSKPVIISCKNGPANYTGCMESVPELIHPKREHHSPMEAAEEKTAASWYVATAAAHHATGNRGLLYGFTPVQQDRFLRSADGAAPLRVLGRGSVITDTVILPSVLYVPGLTANLVSPSQLAELDYTVRFSRGACHIRNAGDGTIVGKASGGEDGLFELDFLKVLPAI